MSESESLRMVAEVVDNFTTPLKNLRAQLQGMSKDGPAHTKAVADGLNRVEGAAKSAGQTASTVLNPALAAIGVTGLGVVAAMNGVGAAMRSLGGSVSALAMLGRETGISAENLRVMQSVMSKFGIEADASAGSIKTFTQNMREARDGIGPIMQFLRTQGRTAEGRAYFGGLADSLKNSKDNSEALMKALEGLEHIQDPAGRMKYAQELFGNADLGRLGDQHLGRLKDIVDQQRKLLGPLDPATVKAAEDFEKAMAGLRGTMQKLGTAIATEAMPYVSEFVTGLKSLADGGRADITGPLRESVREIGKALREIDWKTAGEGAHEFVKGATDGIKSLLDAVHTVAAAIRSLNEGKWLDAIRRLDGADGSLARRAAPQAGDDKIERDEKAGGVRTEIDRTREQGDLQRDLLKEAEANGDKGKAAQMRSALELNSRRMKELEEALQKLTDGTATAQKMSADGTGTGFGGLIHKASFGGGVAGSMGRVGRVLGDRENGIYAPTPEQDGAPRRYGGPVAPGGRTADDGEGERGSRRGRGTPPNTGRDRPPGEAPDTRSPLQRRNLGGGRFGLGGPVAPRVPPVTPGGPGDRVGRWQRGETQPPRMPSEGANPGDYKDVLDHIAKAEGTAGRAGGGYDTSLDYGRWLPGGKEGNLTGKTLDEIDALQTGMLSNPENRRKYGNGLGSSAIGRYQIVRKTLRGLRKKLRLGGDELYDQKMQDRLAAELARARGADPTGLGQEWASLHGERGRRAAELMSKVPLSGSTIPRDRPPTEHADAAGWEARERARKSLDAPSSNDFAEAVRERQAAADKSRSDFGVGSTPMQRALRAGAGGAVLNADGKVEVHVARPGPHTKVSTSASGNLFRDVKLNRGKTMTLASPDG